MNLLIFNKNNQGQALAEMILTIPVLFLFVAGVTQFAVIFLCYVQFEHACGEAARQYAANTLEKDSLGPAIMENLGSLSSYFDPNSLRIRPQEPRNTAAQAIQKINETVSLIPFSIKYRGCEWSVDIKVRPPFCFTLLFPEGMPLHTVMQVYRYPN